MWKSEGNKGKLLSSASDWGKSHWPNGSTGKNKLEGLTKKQAEIVNDTIKFHGAKLNVSVFNSYVSKLDKIDKEINIAADRGVTLEEDGLAVEVSKYIASIKIKTPEKPTPVYGGFLWELPKKLLKKMPIILSYERQGR